LLISPGLALIVALGILPLTLLLGLSFLRIDLATPNLTGWVGLQNYERLVIDHQFWHAMRLSLIYVVATVALQIVVGMSLALLLFRPFHGQNVLRLLVLLPMIMAPVVVGALWHTLLLTQRYGVIDYISESFGFGSHPWLTDPTLALISVIAMHTWQWTPFAFLVFVASLNALSEDMLDASRLDCLAWWHQIWYILLPLLRPAIVVVAILRTIQALNAFAGIYAATGGGPGDATRVLNLYLYEVSFVHLSVGYGSAVGVVQLMLSAVIAAGFIKIRRKE
jgi:multiple sugar transport system permease protein